LKGGRGKRMGGGSRGWKGVREGREKGSGGWGGGTVMWKGGRG